MRNGSRLHNENVKVVRPKSNFFCVPFCFASHKKLRNKLHFFTFYIFRLFFFFSFFFSSCRRRRTRKFFRQLNSFFQFASKIEILLFDIISSSCDWFRFEKVLRPKVCVENLTFQRLKQMMFILPQPFFLCCSFCLAVTFRLIFSLVSLLCAAENKFIIRFYFFCGSANAKQSIQPSSREHGRSNKHSNRQRFIDDFSHFFYWIFQSRNFLFFRIWFMCALNSWRNGLFCINWVIQFIFAYSFLTISVVVATNRKPIWRSNWVLLWFRDVKRPFCCRKISECGKMLSDSIAFNAKAIRK